MATPYTRTQILHEILSRPEWSWLGYAATADTFGPSYLDDVSEFARPNLGVNSYVGRWIDAYDLTEDDDDRVRRAGILDTDLGRLEIDGADYGSTPSGPYRLLGVEPRKLWAAQKTAQTTQYERKTVPLTPGHDFDMLRADVNYWDGTSGSSSLSSATATKVDDEDLVDFGDQALFVNLSGVDGYTRGERIRVSPGQTYLLGAIIRLAAGGGILRVWDYTNSAYIQTADEFTYGGAGFAYVERRIRVPSGCFEIQPQLQGTLATTDMYAAAVFGPQSKLTRRVELPEWADNGFNVQMIRASEFLARIDDGIWDASSRQWIGDLVPGDDFSVEVSDRAANPFQVNFNATESVDWAVGQRPLWVYAQRRLSDKEPLLTEDATTTAPFEQVIAHHQHQIALLAHSLQPDNPRWAELVAKTQLRKAIETIVRPPQRRQERARYQNMRV